MDSGGRRRSRRCGGCSPAFVIMQGFKEYFALGFFQGALLKDADAGTAEGYLVACTS
jgi:hypothetical protein